MCCGLSGAIQNGGYSVIRQLPRKHTNQIGDSSFDRPSRMADFVLLDLQLSVVVALPMNGQRQSVIDDIDYNLFDE